MRTAQRAEGPATVLAIGTANPDNYIFQAEYPDYYFRVTNSEHMTELKAKFKRICERTMIQKRHMHLTEDILKDNPSLCSQVKSSIDARQDIAIAAVPKLGMAAALVAIKEWNRPKSEITHLIFCSTSGVDMPGADYQLVKFLGLSSSVKRLMIYQQGDRTMIQKRHMHLTEDMLKENPSLCSQVESSLDARQAISIAEVPKLGKAASLAAIKEWDRPKHDITHLVFCSTSGVDMPGADYQLVKLLGLRPSVKRLMIYQQGCYTGGSALRIAKDLAENNRGSRILLVCSEVTAVMFRGLPEANLDDIMVGDGPSQIQMDTLVSQALFGDGAAALIIGSDPDLSVEKPIFQIAYATQTILPGSEGCIEGHLTEVGLSYTVKKEVPMIISKNIGKSLEEALAPLGIHEDWNSLFWITHPGGPAILDKVEQTLGLEEERMRATRKVLSEYGNMWGATALFIMDKMRKMSTKQGKSTTGDGMEWGVLLGFGPGITVETVILRSVPI